MVLKRKAGKHHPSTGREPANKARSCLILSAVGRSALDFYDQFLVLKRANKMVGGRGKIWLMRKDQMNCGYLACRGEASV